MRLLGATRLSRHRGEADPSTSPERQEGIITQWAERETETVIGWARDLDVSAITLSPFERPELGVWLNERHREFDGVIWAKLDRAVRKIDDLHALAVWATQHKKVLLFASGPGADLRLDMRGGAMSALSKVILTLLAFAAELEGDAIRERNKSTRDYLRTIGRWPGGMYPYHTMPVKQGNGWFLVPNPDTWPIVEKIVQRVLDNESKLSIAVDLNEQGVLSPREYRIMLTETKVPIAPVTGVVMASHEEASFRPKRSRFIMINPGSGAEPVKVPIFPRQAELAVADGQLVPAGTRLTTPIQWNPKTINDMLRNEAMVGQHKVAGKLILGADGMPVRRVEPLIKNRRDWDRLQRALDETARPTGKRRTRGSASVVLDIGFCAACGSKLHRRSLKGGGGYIYYGCRSHWNGIVGQRKEDRCSMPSIRAEVLEQAIETVLLGEIGHREMFEHRLIPGVDYGDELRDAETALKQCIDDSAGKSPAVRKIYEKKIAELEARITELTSTGTSTEDRVELAGTGMTWQEFWPNAEVQERRERLVGADISILVGKGDDLPVLEATKTKSQPQSRRPRHTEVTTPSGHRVCLFFERGIADRLTSWSS